MIIGALIFASGLVVGGAIGAVVGVSGYIINQEKARQSKEPTSFGL